MFLQINEVFINLVRLFVIPFRIFKACGKYLAARSLSRFLIITSFVDSLVDMLSLAMILYFLTAPGFAVLNYKVMLGNDVPDPCRPGIWLKLLPVSGILFLGDSGWCSFTGMHFCNGSCPYALQSSRNFQNLMRSFRVLMASMTWEGRTVPIFLTSLSRDMDLK